MRAISTSTTLFLSIVTLASPAFAGEKQKASSEKQGGHSRDRGFSRSWWSPVVPKMALKPAVLAKSTARFEPRAEKPPAPPPAPRKSKFRALASGDKDKGGKPRWELFELSDDDRSFYPHFGGDADDDYGKDEGPDLLPEERPAFNVWQKQVKQVLVTAKGDKIPVSYMEVGAPDVAKPTIVHFHGASVTPDNVLVYRLYNAFKEAGKPIRMVSARHMDKREVLEEMVRATGNKVIVMGHSAGAALGSDLARDNPDKVSHFIGMGMNALAYKVPTLVFTGTEDIVSPNEMLHLASGDPNATSVILNDVEHSMRYWPHDARGGKPVHNASKASANVARHIVDSIHQFIGGKEVDATFLKGLAEDVSEGKGVYFGEFHK